jgi:hypothetical protein
MRRRDHQLALGGRFPQRYRAAVVRGAQSLHGPYSKRARGGQRNMRLPFQPPEDWHEPTERGAGFRTIIQPPGSGYRHVVTPVEIRQRLAELPEAFVGPLEVVQLSRMTRKKQGFPCYGMQWGAAIYLYPIEVGLVEFYGQPPTPNQVNEARMYGGRWMQESRMCWKLVWTERAIKDFYLNNILIHELGHLVDQRNSSHVDRERFAEWFAVRHGYQPTQSLRQPPRKPVRRRHARR